MRLMKLKNWWVDSNNSRDVLSMVTKMLRFNKKARLKAQTGRDRN